MCPSLYPVCLLASGLVVSSCFHSVLVDDSGIKVVKVTFNRREVPCPASPWVRLGPPFLGRAHLQVLAWDTYCVPSLALMQATLKIRNSNFYSVAVTSLSVRFST